MLATLSRKMAPKKWSQVYSERADAIQVRRQDKEKMLEQERKIILRARKERMEQMEANKNKETGVDSDDPGDGNPSKMSKVREAMNDCKRSIYNLVPPPSQLDWHAHWGSSLVCYICERPALTECTLCPKCNIISHHLCLQSQAMNTSGASPSSSCPNCAETYQAELDNYYREVERLKYERMLEISAEMVTRRAHVFLAVRRLAKAKYMLTRIQACVRGIIQRIKYRVMKRPHLRVVLLNVNQLPALPEAVTKNGLLIITVMDTFKNIQLFRFDKPLESIMAETVLVPGVASYMTLILTIASKEEAYSFTLTAQAQLCVRDMVSSSMKKEFVLNFMEKILVSLLSPYSHASLC